jgi:type I restriction enzyme R subunit
LLKRFSEDDVKTKSKSNAAQGKKFSFMLSEAIKRYQCGLVEAAQAIAELIELAQRLREEAESGKKLNLW